MRPQFNLKVLRYYWSRNDRKDGKGIQKAGPHATFLKKDIL